MHLLWDSKNKPGEFIVPKERAQHLRYSPDRRPLFGGPPALLPFAYPQDTRVPVDARPRWVRDMTPRLAASSKVLVRQFDEHKHQWEDWIEARVVSGAQNYRPAGLVWTYEVEVQREGKIRREWRTPCLGELWTPDCARPFSSPEEYFLRKRDFNLVYIPILTEVADLTDGCAVDVVIFYTGEVKNMKVYPHMAEWDVLVLNGPYARETVQTNRVCSYDIPNAKAIQKAAKQNHEFVFDFVTDVKCTRVPPGAEITANTLRAYMDPWIDVFLYRM